MIKLFLFFIISLNLYAAPAHVLIIRHAEKEENSNELSKRGFNRAEALVKFFTSSTLSKEYGVPQYIFATQPNNSDGSVRSIQTATPLSNYTKIPINKNYQRDDFDLLTRELLSNPIYDNKTVLIVWAHKRIVDIVDSLGAVDFPKEWKDKHFDRLWVVNFKNNKFSRFDNRPQYLLKGDDSN